MGHIQSIVYQQEPSVHEPPYHYNRTPTESATLVAGYGIEGDRKGGGKPNRNLNVMSAAILTELKAEGYQTGPGEMGEQIVIAGLDLMALPEGARLQLGESAVIVVAIPRTGCGWFEQVQGRPREATAGRMGVMARVETGGPIKVGDAVTVLDD